MNDKIYVLWSKAHTRWTVDYALSDKPREEWRSVPDIFAELIIQECARIAAATPFPDTDEDTRKTFGHTWDMACVESAKNIREHFH